VRSCVVRHIVKFFFECMEISICEHCTKKKPTQEIWA
jgi:hypothetical protein